MLRLCVNEIPQIPSQEVSLFRWLIPVKGLSDFFCLNIDKKNSCFLLPNDRSNTPQRLLKMSLHEICWFVKFVLM